jgi:hypothetical protein
LVEITQDQLDRAQRVLESRWESLGYGALREFERDWIVLWWLRVEVENGGFHQYFFNSAGDGAFQALAALERLGQWETHRILSDAVACFGPIRYSPDCEERRRWLRQVPSKVFGSPTKAFYKRSEDFDAAALARVFREYERMGM